MPRTIRPCFFAESYKACVKAPTLVAGSPRTGPHAYPRFAPSCITRIISRAQPRRHLRRHACRVREKPLESRAEIVEARFALRRAQQAICRALAPAIGEKFALPAIRRQRLGLRMRELDLRRREHHVAERALPDVAQPIPGIDVVVAGVDAAVVREGDPPCRRTPLDADLRRQPHVLDDQRFAETDQHTAEEKPGGAEIPDPPVERTGTMRS